MGEEIPLRWLLFEEALAADKISCMSLDQVRRKLLLRSFETMIYLYGNCKENSRVILISSYLSLDLPEIAKDLGLIPCENTTF